LGDVEPINQRVARLNGQSQRHGAPGNPNKLSSHPRQQIRFDRSELSAILNLYGRKVAAGEWRDYAIDMNAETAEFAVYRRSSECPLARIVKTPKLARKQGAYSVIAPTGMILKRGHDLQRVLSVLDKPMRLVR